MVGIKKGDIVGRKSYNKDILFVVEKIMKSSRGKKIAILKGLTIRIQADSEVDDLEIIDKRVVEENENISNKRFEAKLKKYINEKNKTNNFILKRSSKAIYTGKILHLDGDKKYSDKSSVFYKKMGLKAIVKNIAENRQASVVNELINRYKPDILVITGHERGY